MVWRVISNFMSTFIPRLVLIRIFFEKNKWGFFRKLWGSLKKVGIFAKNVGIFEKKNGGDMWGFLIDEVGILTQKILEALMLTYSSVRNSRVGRLAFEWVIFAANTPYRTYPFIKISKFSKITIKKCTKIRILLISCTFIRPSWGLYVYIFMKVVDSRHLLEPARLLQTLE